MWNDLIVAVALMFVIEGIWPFLGPRGVRRALRIIAEQDDRSIRSLGLISMVVGVVLLYLVN